MIKVKCTKVVSVDIGGKLLPSSKEKEFIVEIAYFGKFEPIDISGWKVISVESDSAYSTGHIINALHNIPHNVKGTTIWKGDLANFIVDNFLSKGNL